MYVSSGNKHFFTKSCHRQTYQNYEQSRQKLGTILENKVGQKLKLEKNVFYKKWSPKLIFLNAVVPFSIAVVMVILLVKW